MCTLNFSLRVRRSMSDDACQGDRRPPVQVELGVGFGAGGVGAGAGTVRCRADAADDDGARGGHGQGERQGEQAALDGHLERKKEEILFTRILPLLFLVQ